MALYTNNVTLKGFLGKDAETIATKQGRSLTVLSLAPSPATRTSRRTSGSTTPSGTASSHSAHPPTTRRT